jgi:polyvinyl alcohol dehydrogenase (cytochrome)
MRYVCLFALILPVLSAQDGTAIYKARCASCHDVPTGRVPTVTALKAMGVPSILHALETGSMKTQAAELSVNERYAVAVYLGIPGAKTAPDPQSAFCSGPTPPFRDSSRGPSWAGWSTRPDNTRFQDSGTAGLSSSEVPKLKLKWAFGLGGGVTARSQPAVAGDRIFLGTQTGAVYSLDAKTGCIYWTAEVDQGIRSALVYGSASGPTKQPAVYFGAGTYTYAFDAATGKLLWKAHIEDHFAAGITAAPQLYRGTLYVAVSSGEEGVAPLPTYECCTFRGSVVALDAASGKVLWKTYTIAESPKPTRKTKTGAQMYGPSGAAVWSTPTFDEKRNAVYVATGDNYSDPSTNTSDAVIALDAQTGKILWSRQLTPYDTYNVGCEIPGKVNCPDSTGPDLDFGQPPILVSLPSGRRALVIGQKSGMAHALDPDRQGKILWQTRVGKGGPLGGSQWGSAADRENMYVAISDYVVRIADPKAPQGFRNDLNPDQSAGLFALRLTTGEKVWSATPSSCGERKGCSSAHSAAVAVIPGSVFAGSLDGHLRAFSTSTGEILWDIDTACEYQTLNGQKARGGSLDGPGPVIAGGMLYVNSGYGQFGGIPGNVFLAFSVDGK